MISEILKQAVQEIEQYEQSFPVVYARKRVLIEATKQAMILAAMELWEEEAAALPTCLPTELR